VGTMATLYSVDGDDIAPVRERMAEEINPSTGKPYFNLAVGVSLLLFYAFALQCMSTLAVVVRETQSWRFALIQFAAYVRGCLCSGVVRVPPYFVPYYIV